MNVKRAAYSNWVGKIMAINVAIYIFQNVLSVESLNGIVHYFGLTPALVLKKGYVWQFVSYMFLHGNLLHVLFNMSALLVFGAPIEHLWGSKRFLQFYFFTGIGAGLTIFIMNGLMLNAPNIATIGASGAIFGLLLAFGLVFPNTQILLFFVLPIKAKYLVIIYGVITLSSIISPESGGNISHVGHLGGLIFGFLYFVYYGRFGKRWSLYALKENVLSGKSNKPPEKAKDDIVELELMLKKLRDGGTASLSDDEFQKLKYMQIMTDAKSEHLCSEADFNLDDEHCKKCDWLKNCILREAGKYLK